MHASFPKCSSTTNNMQPISLLLPELSIADVRPKIRNERQYANSLFVDRLYGLKDKKGKVFEKSFFCFMMSHLSIPDLYAFYKTCDTYKDGFSKCWFGALKDRPKGYIPMWKRRVDK